MSATSILVVEDEPATLTELCEFLAEEGYEVTPAGNGAEALRAFERRRREIVVTDVRMPEMNGLELLRRIKKISEKTSVVIVTGHGSESLAVEALRAGASNYLKKPIDLGALERIIIGLVAVSGARELDLVAEGMLREESRTLEIPSDPSLIPAVVRDLGRSLPLLFDFTSVERLETALAEMIENAIEHGNLAISYGEKVEARELGLLEKLIAGRRSDPRLAERRVRIAYKLGPGGVEFRVADEGKGFDWRGVLASADAGDLLRESGRGIVLSSFFVDELRYNNAGNEVTLIKKAGRPASSGTNAGGPPPEAASQGILPL